MAISQETLAHSSEAWGWGGDRSVSGSKVHLTRNVTPIPHNAACRSLLATLLDFIALVEASGQVCPDGRPRSRSLY